MGTSPRLTSQQERARNARLVFFEQATTVPKRTLDAPSVVRSNGMHKDDAERARRLQRLEKLHSTAASAKDAELSVGVAQSTMADEMNDDDVLKAALALSLQPLNEAGTSSGQPFNMWSPPRYVPAHEAVNKTLRLVEHVRVRDGGYAWQPATAFLDTGNQHMTLVDTRFAAALAIYRPDAPGGIFGQAERWTTLHGVVPGASSKAPIVTIALDIRGQTFTIPAAVSQMQGHDLLLGIDVLQQLFAAGFSISAGSV